MERKTYRVAGDDHAVEQRAHGVEAAHVQACRWGRNTGSGREKRKARESWNIRVGAAERIRVRRPRARTFSKTESHSEGKISIKGLHPVGPHRLPLLTLTSFYYYSGLPAMHCEKLRHRLKKVTLRPGGASVWRSSASSRCICVASLSLFSGFLPRIKILATETVNGCWVG